MKEKILSLPKAARFAIMGASGFIFLCCLCLLVIAIIPSNKTSTQVTTAITSPTSENGIPEIPSNTAQPDLLLTDTPLALETQPTTPASKPSSTPDPFSKLIVPAGELAKYLDTYSNYKEVFVTKLDGSLDERPNDLEELCLDWLYYRNKILEYTQAGKTDKAADARTAWNEINAWLNEYNENDVSTMFLIIENRNK